MTRRDLLSLAATATSAAARTPSLGGRGCILHNGRLVTEWGDQSLRRDVLSAAKPVLTTLLFFALHEKLLPSIHTPLARFDWPLAPKDRAITFAHLTAMTSGYARPEPPGAAFAYNDYAINLYQLTLFDRVFRQPPELAAARLANALSLPDGLLFRPTNRRISASVRDFARIAEFWRNKGAVDGRQILPASLFDQYCRPQVPRHTPLSRPAETNDYLKIGTYGGGSEHFTPFGAGIYGGNWWFNGTGRYHPDSITWPDAPRDTFMAIGARGNNAAVIPSRGLVLVAMDANWGAHAPGNPAAPANQHLRELLIP